jgi:hypothetical protein
MISSRLAKSSEATQRSSRSHGLRPSCQREVRVDDREVLVELLVQFVLPLHGQRRGAQDEHPVGDRPQAQLLDQQAGHDCLARARVVGEHEPQPRLGQHVAVHGDDLVRQAADPGQADREVRVMGVGERDPLGLHEVKEVAARHERRALFDRLDQPVAEILVGEGRLLERSGVGAHAQQVGASADRLHALKAHGADEMPAQADAPAGKVLKHGWTRIGAHALAQVYRVRRRGAIGGSPLTGRSPANEYLEYRM